MLASWLVALSFSALSAPVSDVTVYSDRARVVRSAKVPLSGTSKLEFPLLIEGIDPASIRLEATGAEVKRVDVAHVDAQAFPKTEARQLLDQLDALDDQLRTVDGERSSVQGVIEVLNRIRPTLPPADPAKPAPKLNASGWKNSLEFGSNLRDKMQARVRAASEKLDELGRQRTLLLEQAAKLDAARRGGYRVTATVSGNGPAKLALSYIAARARWFPVYDLTLVPERSEVQVVFAALVSQETGEPWTDAHLTVSTAVPASATSFPKLLSWKIGEKERFIPTPAPAQEYVPPAPPSVPLLAIADVDEVQLRRRLAQRLGSTRGTREEKPHAGEGWAKEIDRDGDGIPDAKDNEDAKAQVSDDRPSPPPPPAAPRSAPQTMAAPSIPEPVMETETVASGRFAFDQAEVKPIVQVGLAPPPGYQPPSYAGNLPAALAGGYDLAFPSVQAETVPSGGGAKRVALFAKHWPVNVERKLFPALSPEAFLVAELKNPEASALPGGEANLYVGGDPAGTAHLNFVAPGEPFTLPLGLDRAIKPIRNVKLVEAEQGFIGKDQVNRYDVSIEVANPYAVPITVKIFDQWPLTDDPHVQVKLLSSQPFAKQEALTGALQWNLTLGPRSTTTVGFSYSIRRPKDYQLHQ